MSKFVVLILVSLDGIMQATGGKGDDPSGGFQLEGRTVTFLSDAAPMAPRFRLSYFKQPDNFSVYTEGTVWRK
jgi:hypothetical protein